MDKVIMIVREAELTDAFSISKINMGKMTDSKACDAKRKPSVFICK